jgi:hypothetical protein
LVAWRRAISMRPSARSTRSCNLRRVHSHGPFRGPRRPCLGRWLETVCCVPSNVWTFGGMSRRVRVRSLQRNFTSTAQQGVRCAVREVQTQNGERGHTTHGTGTCTARTQGVSFNVGMLLVQGVLTPRLGMCWYVLTLVNTLFTCVNGEPHVRFVDRIV